MTNEEIPRYSRHLVLSDVGMKGQKALKNASVLVIGAGEIYKIFMANKKDKWIGLILDSLFTFASKAVLGLHVCCIWQQRGWDTLGLL